MSEFDNILLNFRTTSEQYTGRLRWRQGTLEQEVQTILYNDDGKAMGMRSGWMVVPVEDDNAQP